MTSEYLEFLKKKTHSSIDFGIENKSYIDGMFDFQKFIVDFCSKKGRCAGFIDTGLGKTIIEICLAKNFSEYTGKPVLIMTPLAVAFQFIEEAKKFNVLDISYSKDGKINSKIVVCNYERLDKFNPENFDTVILDESSILKNFEGETKSKITSFLKNVKYRFLFTATPSPNDYIELGTSSEALGGMGYMDMLSKFFKNNNGNTVKSQRIEQINKGNDWYLKRHAEIDFWKWVSSWSISLRKPSDIGFSDDKYILPELKENYHIVNNENLLEIDGQFSMFNFPAENFREIKAEVRGTLKSRCEKAVEISRYYDTSVYWVNLNDESKLISDLDDNSIEIEGSMDIDKKEEILLSFSRGEIKKLVTKTSITAFGLNWQHCNHTIYFPTYSFERYYQAIRRFWRFGQKRPVTVDLVLSDGQTKIMDAVKAKKENAVKMFENLVFHSNSGYEAQIKKFDKQIIKPTFLGAK